MKKLLDGMERYDRIMGTIALMAMLAVVFWQVVSRYFLGTSLRWSEEYARYLMLYLSFLGVGAGIKRQKHMGVDFFDALLPPKPKKVLKVLAAVVTLGILVVFTYYSGQTALRIGKSGQVSPAGGLPMWIPYATIPLGFFAGIIRQIEQILLLLHTDHRSGDEEQ